MEGAMNSTTVVWPTNGKKSCTLITTKTNSYFHCRNLGEIWDLRKMKKESYRYFLIIYLHGDFRVLISNTLRCNQAWQRLPSGQNTKLVGQHVECKLKMTTHNYIKYKAYYKFLITSKNVDTVNQCGQNRVWLLGLNKRQMPGHDYLRNKFIGWGPGSLSHNWHIEIFINQNLLPKNLVDYSLGNTPSKVRTDF